MLGRGDGPLVYTEGEDNRTSSLTTIKTVFLTRRATRSDFFHQIKFCIICFWGLSPDLLPSVFQVLLYPVLTLLPHIPKLLILVRQRSKVTCVSRNVLFAQILVTKAKESVGDNMSEVSGQLFGLDFPLSEAGFLGVLSRVGPMNLVLVSSLRTPGGNDVRGSRSQEKF